MSINNFDYNRTQIFRRENLIREINKIVDQVPCEDRHPVDGLMRNLRKNFYFDKPAILDKDFLASERCRRAIDLENESLERCIKIVTRLLFPEKSPSVQA